MATTKQLLKLSTAGAVVRMLNDENLTNFDGSEYGPLIISPPLNLGGERTEVELSVRRKLSRMETLPFQGKLAFRYNRLDVENTIGKLMEGFRPPMPTSTRVILNEIEKRMQISIELNDFVLEDIIRSNAAPYRLKAKSESLRWVGEMDIVLLDLIDLDAHLISGLPSTPRTLDQSAQYVDGLSVLPYLNGTRVSELLESIPVGETVQDLSDPLAQALIQVLGEPGHYMANRPSPWQVSNTASAFNLRGASLRARRALNTPINKLVPQLNRVVEIQLGALDTRFTNKLIQIPYLVANFAARDFTDQPRLKSSAVVNASNGTPWNKWLNALAVPTVLKSLPVPSMLISGPVPWVVNADVPSPTNLYNAVVQYNGARRPYDMAPFDTTCNRVIQLSVSEHNTAYRENILFHYRAPIILREALPGATVNVPYSVDLAPSEGRAPYTTRIVSGSLAPNHQLTADHKIEGPTTGDGSYNVTIAVRDADGVEVHYTYAYRSVIAPITIEGTPPDAKIGTPYSHTFPIQGGVAPYEIQIIDGVLPPGITVPTPTNPTISGTPTGTARTYSFQLAVIDKRGTPVYFSYSIKVST